MGALPSRESQENPSKLYYAQVGDVRAAYVPLTRHFFPSPTCLAFQQLFDARRHQSAKYYYIPLSHTPAKLDANGNPIEDEEGKGGEREERSGLASQQRATESDVTHRDAKTHEQDSKKSSGAETTQTTPEKDVSSPPPSSSYLLDRQPRLIPFLARPDRPTRLHAAQPLQVEGAQLDAVTAAPRQPEISCYEAVTSIHGGNYSRFFSHVASHCVEDETADVATVLRHASPPSTPRRMTPTGTTRNVSARTPDEDEDGDEDEKPQNNLISASTSHKANPAAKGVSSASPSASVPHADSEQETPNFDVSIAYDRHCRNRKYYYCSTAESLYAILVAQQAAHVLDTDGEMCELYAQEQAWLAERRRLRRARQRAQLRTQRCYRAHTPSSAASSPAASAMTEGRNDRGNACAPPPPPPPPPPTPPKAFIRPISEAAVVFLSNDEEAQALAEHSGLSVEKALERVVKQTLRPPMPSRGAERVAPPQERLRHRFESEAMYKDGRLHLVEDDGVLYLFAYKTPAQREANGAEEEEEVDVDSVDAFAVPIQPVRVFGANCVIESWCRATPWTRGLDDDPEEDAYIEFEMTVKPPVMRPAWFVDARVGGERLFAQLACKGTVLYARLCRSAGLPCPLVRPGWEKDPLFGLPMLQTNRRLSAYILAKLRMAAASGELARRTLEDIKAVLASAKSRGVEGVGGEAQGEEANVDGADSSMVAQLLAAAKADTDTLQSHGAGLDNGNDNDDEGDEEGFFTLSGETPALKNSNTHRSEEAVESADQRALVMHVVHELVHQCELLHVKIDGLSTDVIQHIVENGTLPQRNSRYRPTFSVRGNYGIVRARPENLLFFFKVYDILGFDDTLLDEALALEETPADPADTAGGDAHKIYPGAPPASDAPLETFSEQLYDYGGTVRVHDLRAPPTTQPTETTETISPTTAPQPEAHEQTADINAHNEEMPKGVGESLWSSRYIQVLRVASFVRPPEEAQVLPPPTNIDDVRENAALQERQWVIWLRYLMKRFKAKASRALRGDEDVDEKEAEENARCSDAQDESLSDAVKNKPRTLSGNSGEREGEGAAAQAGVVPVMVFIAVNTSRLAEGPSSTHAAYIESLIEAVVQEDEADASTQDTITDGCDEVADKSVEPVLPSVVPHRFMYPAHFVLDSQLLVYNCDKGEWEHLAVFMQRNALRSARVLRQVEALFAQSSSPQAQASVVVSTSTTVPRPLDAQTVLRHKDVGFGEVLVCWIKRVQRQIPLANRHDPGWLRDPVTGRIVQQGRYYMYSFEKAGEMFYCGVVPHFATDRRKMKKKMLREAAAAAAAAGGESANTKTPLTPAPSSHTSLADTGARSVSPSSSFVKPPSHSTAPAMPSVGDVTEPRAQSSKIHTPTTALPPPPPYSSSHPPIAPSSSSALNTECSSATSYELHNNSASTSISPFPEPRTTASPRSASRPQQTATAQPRASQAVRNNAQGLAMAMSPSSPISPFGGVPPPPAHTMSSVSSSASPSCTSPMMRAAVPQAHTRSHDPRGIYGGGSYASLYAAGSPPTSHGSAGMDPTTGNDASHMMMPAYARQQQQHGPYAPPYTSPHSPHTQPFYPQSSDPRQQQQQQQGHQRGGGGARDERANPQRRSSHSEKRTLALSHPHPMEDSGLAESSPMRAGQNLSSRGMSSYGVAGSVWLPTSAGAGAAMPGHGAMTQKTTSSQKALGTSGRYVWNPYSGLQ